MNSTAARVSASGYVRRNCSYDHSTAAVSVRC
jgi:hypothetical protein